MFAAHRIVVPLQVLLVLAAAYAVVLLVLSVPGSAFHAASQSPAAAVAVVPIAFVAEAGLLGFLVVAVCTWRLLSLVRQDRIFTPASMRWVDVIVGTFVGGWLALVALALYLGVVLFVTPAQRDPGIPILLVGAVLLGAVLVMLVAVLRTLLRRATAMQDDLDGVL